MIVLAVESRQGKLSFLRAFCLYSQDLRLDYTHDVLPSSLVMNALREALNFTILSISRWWPLLMRVEQPSCCAHTVLRRGQEVAKEGRKGGGQAGQPVCPRPAGSPETLLAGSSAA